jgi:hypothetical protein
VELVDVVGPHAELRLGLHQHPPRPAEAVEVVHIRAAQERLQRRVDVGDGYPQRLRLVGIQIDTELRNRRPKPGVDRRDFRPLTRGLHERLRHLRELGEIAVAAVLQHQLEAAGRTLGIGAAKVRGHLDDRRDDFGIGGDRQIGNRGRAENDGDDRDDNRENRSIDEELGHGSLSVRGDRVVVGARCHACARPDLLQAVDDDRFAGLQPLLDDPPLIDSLAGDDASRDHGVVGSDAVTPMATVRTRMAAAVPVFMMVVMIDIYDDNHV